MSYACRDLPVCCQESKSRSKTGSYLNMLPRERSVSPLLPNDLKRCVNKYFTHLSATQATGKECGRKVLSARYQRGVSSKTNRSVKSEAEQLMGLLTLQMQYRL